jgi:PqqD family protein of HPr-rel-A system
MPTPTRRSDVTVQHVGGDIILHDGARGRAHVVNATAARILELCDGTATSDEIAAALAATYGIDAAVARADVERTLAAFQQLQLVD